MVIKGDEVYMWYYRRTTKTSMFMGPLLSRLKLCFADTKIHWSTTVYG